MIQKNDDDKTTTQPKRERERESVLRTRVIITPIIAIHISHIIGVFTAKIQPAVNHFSFSKN